MPGEHEQARDSAHDDSSSEMYDPLGKGVPTERLGEDCPVCPRGELVKPRSERPQCPVCRHVKNPMYGNPDLHDFPVTYRQGKRLIDALGYSAHGTPGDIGTRLRRVASDHEMEAHELADLLADLGGAYDG